eukprot:15336057-Heterocapsa_arctica.AAC.1
MLSSWGLQAWDKFPRAQFAEQVDQGPQPKLRARTAKAQEVFAGTGRVTECWIQAGGTALPPIELYAD